MDRATFVLAVAASAFVLFWPTPPGTPLFPYADKIVHAAVFLAIAWTGSRVGIPVRALAVGLVLYAVASEVVQQTLLAGRQGDVTDVAADLVGAAVGLLLGRAGRSTPGAR